MFVPLQSYVFHIYVVHLLTKVLQSSLETTHLSIHLPPQNKLLKHTENNITSSQ